MSNTTQCSFSSINDVITQANQGLLDIATTAAVCQNICQLAWGVGNPDLSGVGTNISYIIQGILTFIFGPLICLTYTLRARLGITKKGEKILQDLHASFLDIAAQSSIPVSVGAIVRFTQHAPFYELSFLRPLTIMQFLSVLSTVWPTAIFEENPSVGRIVSIIIYVSLQFGLLVGFIASLSASGASWRIISALTNACKGYTSTGFEHVPEANLHSSHLPVNAFYILGFIFTGIVGLAIVSIIFATVVIAVKKKTARGLGLLCLAFSVGTMVELSEMEHTRKLMQNVTGNKFQDNQWGIGQIVASFSWAPFCVLIAYCEYQSLAVRLSTC